MWGEMEPERRRAGCEKVDGITSAAACTGAERDNLPVSDIKGEKAKSFSFAGGVQHNAWWIIPFVPACG